MNYELLIQTTVKKVPQIMAPVLAEGVSIEWERKGQPGKMTFEVYKDEKLSFAEGDPVRFSVDGKVLFYGFVFDKSRKGQSAETISVTAYDQLYYLKNKDTYVYTNKKASDVVKMIAKDFRLNLGTVDDTKYVIPSRTEDNTSLFDIIQNALDETLKAKGKMYILYDDAGELCLRLAENLQGTMKTKLYIDETSAGDFNYSTSIADDTYNQIKLIYENSDTGTRELYIAKDSENQNKWGILQYFEKVNDKTRIENRAQSLLGLYNNLTRKLTVSDAIGDVRVRAGMTVFIHLTLGDIIQEGNLMVEQVKHTFKDNEHLMELKLRGGTFVA